VVWPAWPTPAIPLPCIWSSPKPKTRGIRDRLCRLCGAENTEREKLSGRQKSAKEIPSQRGEIVAIVITIKLGFIGIIIFITTPSRCNILG
jgi:hypothetical protein